MNTIPGRFRPASPVRPPAADNSISEILSIYRDLASRPADRDCRLRTGCCRFAQTGKIPYLTRGEAVVAARAVRAAGMTKLPEPADGACPLLDPRTSRCRIYDSRPFACRTHFCREAGGPYARRDVLDLIRRLERVDAALGGDGPHALPGAVGEALRTGVGG